MSRVNPIVAAIALSGLLAPVGPARATHLGCCKQDNPTACTRTRTATCAPKPDGCTNPTVVGVRVMEISEFAEMHTRVAAAKQFNREAHGNYEILPWSSVKDPDVDIIVDDPNDSPCCAEAFRDRILALQGQCKTVSGMYFFTHGATGSSHLQGGGIRAGDAQRWFGGMSCAMKDGGIAKFFSCESGRGCTGTGFMRAVASNLFDGKKGSVKASPTIVTEVPFSHYSLDDMKVGDDTVPGRWKVYHWNVNMPGGMETTAADGQEGCGPPPGAAGAPAGSAH